MITLLGRGVSYILQELVAPMQLLLVRFADLHCKVILMYPASGPL
jgi:hypothetical protein